MRKVCLTAMAFLFLLAAGCSAGRQLKAEDLIFTFSCKTDIVCAEESATCSYSRSGMEAAELSVLSGHAQGLGCLWNGDGFSLTYLGLAAQSSACILPDGSYASVLVKTMDAAAQNGALTWTHGCEFSGNAAGYDFTLTADPDTGRIKTLSVPDRDFQATFYDYEQKALEADASAEYPPD